MILTDHFSNFDNEAKVWVYQADRNFTATEANEIDYLINNFVNEWAAHGTKLNAKGKLLFNRFIVLMVDETMQNATGCSIDSSINFIQNLGNQFNVNWFNRMKVVYMKNETLLDFNFSELASLIEDETINDETLIFNNLVQNKEEWLNNWIIPLNKSWLAKQMA